MTKSLEMSDAERAAEYRRRRIEDESPLGADAYGNVVLSRAPRPIVIEIVGEEKSPTTGELGGSRGLRMRGRQRSLFGRGKSNCRWWSK